MTTLRRPTTRLNLGCGAYHLGRTQGVGWINLDDDPRAEPDWLARVPPIPFAEASVDEVYMGHLLEHLEPTEAHDLLRECLRVLVPGGKLGVVVPDTRAILEAYLGRKGERIEVPEGVWWTLDDLDAVCSVFLYSTIQDSRHQWSYDRTTLCRTLERAGFQVGQAIDRYHDPRLSTGRWFQCGYDCIKPGEA